MDEIENRSEKLAVLFKTTTYKNDDRAGILSEGKISYSWN